MAGLASRDAVQRHAAAGSPGIGTANYKVECDLNRDGVVNLSDVLLVRGLVRRDVPGGCVRA